MRPIFILISTLLWTPAFAQDVLPVETVFRNPQYSNVQLSPDGSKLAALAPMGQHRNLVVIDLHSRTATAATKVGNTDVANYFWISNRRLVVEYANLNDASASIHLQGRIAVDFDGANQRGVWSSPGTRIVGVSPFLDDSIIVSASEYGNTSPHAFRLDTRTGDQKLLTWENPGDVALWIPDHDGRVRAAVAINLGANRQRTFYRPDGEKPWRKIDESAADSDEKILPLAFDFDGKSLFVWSNRGRDKGGIFRVDPETMGFSNLVYTGEATDAGSLIFDASRHALVGVRTRESKSGVAWIDEHWKQIQATIDAALPDTMNRITWAWSNPDLVVVSASSDVQPETFYLFNVGTRQLEELLQSRKWIDPKKMAPMREVHYRARDGLDIPAYLVTPRGSSDSKLPLVVIIHGGPNAGTYSWGFDEEAQFLASRGYAVLLPNFRGTPGYGRAFLEAGYRQWGQAMQDDITDGVRWAIKEGIADKDRVCLYGGSYGGYAALMGTIKEPGMFRCAIAFVAVTDIEMLFDLSWYRWGIRDPMERGLLRTVGDLDVDKQKFRTLSPAWQASKVSAPVLLAYGEEDLRVPLKHGREFANALKDAGKPYELVIYPKEGHGFNLEANRFDFYHRVEAFLKKYIGTTP